MTDFGIGIQKEVNCDYIWGEVSSLNGDECYFLPLAGSTLGLTFFYEHVLLL